MRPNEKADRDRYEQDNLCQGESMSNRTGKSWMPIAIVGLFFGTFVAPALNGGSAQLNPPRNLSVRTIFFKSNAEIGDLSEWVGDRGGHVFSYAGEGWSSLWTAAVHASTDQSHSGQHSFRCYLPNPRQGSNANMYRERAGDRAAAFYSCWFWFDPAFTPTEWVNVFQWKTKMGVYPPLCDPTFVINVLYKDGARFLHLYHWPVGEGLIPPSPGDPPGGGFLQVNPKPIPSATWVHIQAFYKIDRVNGEVIVWQDGQEIFHAQHVNSQDARTDHPNDPGTLLWGVGNYSSSNNAGPLLLYIDDMVISDAASE
jgi:hypothetical protein